MTTPPDLSAVLRGRRSRAIGAATSVDLETQRSAYVARRPAPIGRIALSVDGNAYPGAYEALLDGGARFERAELTATEWAPSGPSTEFVRPFRRLLFHSDGSADLHPASGMPERAIARFLPREGFGPSPSGPSFGVGRLPTLAQLVQAVRAGGYVPFSLALELYCSNERLRYELDLEGMRVLPDPRAGRIPVNQARRHPSRASWNFDRAVSGAALSPSAARVLETVWEMGAVSETNLARVFGPADGGPEAILRLSRLHLIEADPAEGGWRVRPDSLGRPGRSAPPSSSAREEETPLRHSMGELLAGAEARATCPMCGEEFPSGYRGLLCDRCTREVEHASRAS